MTTSVNICNSALFHVGAEQITSLSETSKAAKLCNAKYDIVKKRLLASHPWNFALVRTELARLSASPAFEWTYQFQLPADCLRVLSIDENEDGRIEFVIEGDKLLCDESSVKILYISNIGEGYFTPHFSEALSIKLAADIAYAMTNSTSLSDALFEKAKQELALARSFDGQEGNKNRYYADTFTDVRY